MSRYLFLTDFIPGDRFPFLDGFEKSCGERPDVHCCASNWLRTNLYRKIKRYVLYFLFPLRQLRYYGRYETIVSYQQFYALNLAFFLRLIGIRKRSRIVAMSFIYKKKKGFAGRLYQAYIGFCVRSVYIDRFIVSSTHEADYYAQELSCDRNRFAFTYMGIDDKPDIPVTKGDYVFSAGRSNRDYDFLFRVFQELPRRLVVATDSFQGSVPEDVCLLDHCDGEQLQKQMAAAFCVVLPLQNPSVSSGQLVLLQALQLGKPVIVTESAGVIDYVQNGLTGLLMKNDPDQLKACLARLEDESFYNDLSQRGRDFVTRNCTVYAQGEAIGLLVAELK